MTIDPKTVDKSPSVFPKQVGTITLENPVRFMTGKTDDWDDIFTCGLPFVSEDDGILMSENTATKFKGPNWLVRWYRGNDNERICPWLRWGVDVKKQRIDSFRCDFLKSFFEDSVVYDPKYFTNKKPISHCQENISWKTC